MTYSAMNTSPTLVLEQMLLCCSPQSSKNRQKALEFSHKLRVQLESGMEWNLVWKVENLQGFRNRKALNSPPCLPNTASFGEGGEDATVDEMRPGDQETDKD